MSNDNENITFELYDSSSNDGFEQELDDLIHDSKNSIVTESNNYNVNFTIKQLLVICDYYGLSKTLKPNKNNKEFIVNVLVLFIKLLCTCAVQCVISQDIKYFSA
jgi:hypothetical protein